MECSPNLCVVIFISGLYGFTLVVKIKAQQDMKRPWLSSSSCFQVVTCCWMQNQSPKQSHVVMLAHCSTVPIAGLLQWLDFCNGWMIPATECLQWQSVCSLFPCNCKKHLALPFQVRPWLLTLLLLLDSFPKSQIQRSRSLQSATTHQHFSQACLQQH